MAIVLGSDTMNVDTLADTCRTEHESTATDRYTVMLAGLHGSVLGRYSMVISFLVDGYLHSRI